jgi:hypothetical protein
VYRSVPSNSTSEIHTTTPTTVAQDNMSEGEEQGAATPAPEGVELAEIVVPTVALGVAAPVALDAAAHAQAAGTAQVLQVQGEGGRSKGSRAPKVDTSAPGDMYLSTGSVITPKAAVSSLEWHNINYAVPLPAKKAKVKGEPAPPVEMKQLLHGLNGEILAGQVVAIMGGSGRGSGMRLGEGEGEDAGCLSTFSSGLAFPPPCAL